MSLHWQMVVYIVKFLIILCHDGSRYLWWQLLRTNDQTNTIAKKFDYLRNIKVLRNSQHGTTALCCLVKHSRLAPCQTCRYQQAFGSNCFQENYCKMTFSNSTSTNVHWPGFVLHTFTFDAQSKATSECLVALAHVSWFIYTHNDGECISLIMILVRWCIIPGEVEPWECMQEINHVFDSWYHWAKSYYKYWYQILIISYFLANFADIGPYWHWLQNTRHVALVWQIYCLNYHFFPAARNIYIWDECLRWPNHTCSGKGFTNLKLNIVKLGVNTQCMIINNSVISIVIAILNEENQLFYGLS